MIRRLNLSRVFLKTIFACAFISTLPAGDGDNWPQFRGSGGRVYVDGVVLAEEWSETRNVVWVTDIVGRGWSSPIVWDGKVILTTAVSAGDFKEPTTGIYGNDYIRELIAQGLPQEEVMRRVRERDNETSQEASAGIRWMVVCLDAETGKILWQKEAFAGTPFGGRHRKNTYASETPVTDGERIYAYFGNVGLFCYSMDGRLLWSRSWKPRQIYLDFGTASSPALFGGRLFILNDNQEENQSFLVALDAATGEEVWRVARQPNHNMMKSGFTTPFLWNNSKRTEIVALGPGILSSYDLTGKELWHFKGTSAVAAPTPLADSERLYVGSGSPSEQVRPLFAVTAGASGDISLAKKEKSNEFVPWYHAKGGSYITSPILYQGRFFVLYDKGFLAAFDPLSGRELYKVRLGKGGHPFSSSPWASGGKIFCLSEDGDTFVIEAGDDYREIRRNSLGEMTLATPAISGKSLFIRTSSKLYRIEDTGR